MYRVKDLETGSWLVPLHENKSYTECKDSFLTRLYDMTYKKIYDVLKKYKEEVRVRIAKDAVDNMDFEEKMLVCRLAIELEKKECDVCGTNYAGEICIRCWRDETL